MKLEKLEKELFDVEEICKRKKAAFTKLKRKHTELIGRRGVLNNELRDIQKSVDKQKSVHENKKLKS